MALVEQQAGELARDPLAAARRDPPHGGRNVADLSVAATGMLVAAAGSRLGGAGRWAAWLAGGAVAAYGLLRGSVLVKPFVARPAERQAARALGWGSAVMTVRQVTILCPREELVALLGDRGRRDLILADLKAPDRAARRIIRALRLAAPGAAGDGRDMRRTGSWLELKAAPQDRGTEVHLTLVHRPRFGRIDVLIDRLQGRDADGLADLFLRRLKQLAETGEITTSEPRRENG